MIHTFEKLCVELRLEKNPPVLLVGKQALDFIENHFADRNKRVPSNANGFFLYENLNEEYIEKNNIDKRCYRNGVVCLLKDKKSTLIHEMRHAYQLQNNPEYMYLEKYEELSREYTETYVYYPSEEDAFTYTINYLKENSEKPFKLDYLHYKLNYMLLRFEYYIKMKLLSAKRKLVDRTA